MTTKNAAYEALPDMTLDDFKAWLNVAAAEMLNDSTVSKANAIHTIMYHLERVK